LVFARSSRALVAGPPATVRDASLFVSVPGDAAGVMNTDAPVVPVELSVRADWAICVTDSVAPSKSIVEPAPVRRPT